MFINIALNVFNCMIKYFGNGTFTAALIELDTFKLNLRSNRKRLPLRTP